MKNQAWFKFYPRDWMTDEKLRRCCQATRCFWLEAICHMYLSDTVSLTGSCDELSRLMSCTVADVHTAVSDLKMSGAAEIEERNGIITLTSRRRVKEFRRLEICTNAGNISAALRQKHPQHGSVSDSDSSSLGIGDARGKGGDPPGFLRFWAAWPRHHRKADRQQCIAKWRARNCEAMADAIVASVEAHKVRSPDWLRTDKDCIPAPLVWLNKGRWEAVLPEVVPDAKQKWKEALAKAGQNQ